MLHDGLLDRWENIRICVTCVRSQSHKQQLKRHRTLEQYQYLLHSFGDVQRIRDGHAFPLCSHGFGPCMV